MGLNLTSRQQAQLQWLTTLPPKFDKMTRIIEQMSMQQADDVQVRSLSRMLDEAKAQASGLGVATLSDTFGYMGTLLRRGGGHQLKVRGLRELLVGAKVNFEGAMRSATLEADPNQAVGNDVRPSP